MQYEKRVELLPKEEPRVTIVSPPGNTSLPVGNLREPSQQEKEQVRLFAFSEIVR
jgi:hypothetical protein